MIEGNKKIIFAASSILFSSIFLALGLFYVLAQNAYAAPTIQVNSPNGGEALSLGDSLVITWSVDGLPSDILQGGFNVYINHATDTSSSVLIGESLDLETRSHTWNISSLTEGSYIIQINASFLDSNNVGFYPSDESDTSFLILTGDTQTFKLSGTVSYDEDGDGTHDTGENLWISSGDYGCQNSFTVEGTKIKILYTGFGKEYALSICGNQASGKFAGDGVYFETDPIPVGTEVTATVIEPDGWKSTWPDPVMHTVVSENFLSFALAQTVDSPIFQVVSPNGGEELVQGSTHIIKWNSLGLDVSSVRISLYQSGVFKEILEAEVPNTGSWTWSVPSVATPSTITTGTKYSIRIFNLAYPNDYDDSNAYFSIVSTSVSDIIPPDPPRNVVVIEDTCIGGVPCLKITWQNPLDSDFQKTNVYRSNTAGVPGSLIGSNTGSIYTDNRATQCVTYYYTLRSVDTSDNISLNTDQYSGQLGVGGDGICAVREEYPDGTLVKLPEDPNIYVIVDGKRKRIPNPETFTSYGYEWGNIVVVNQVTINLFSEVSLVRAEGDDRVFEIVSGKKYWIPTLDVFNERSFDWGDVVTINSTELNSYSRVRLLRASGDSRIYYLTETGLKRHIPTAEVFNSYGNRWEDVVTVSSFELATYLNNSLIRADGDSKVYKLENGTKRWVKTAEAFNRLGYDWSSIAPCNTVELNAYPTGSAIE